MALFYLTLALTTVGAGLITHYLNGSLCLAGILACIFLNFAALHFCRQKEHEKAIKLFGDKKQ